MTGSDGLSLADVAERLGVHYMTVYRYVRTGRLRAQREGTQWVVLESELSRFDVERHPTPTKTQTLFPLAQAVDPAQHLFAFLLEDGEQHDDERAEDNARHIPQPLLGRRRVSHQGEQSQAREPTAENQKCSDAHSRR